ncbi:MBL fold metallo-hydrolase [Silicimonas algicola]|uniref:Hydroxyacylglutathione hydrolase n=1 Tax=Silicimonas algicola TaxID=1826607 RepID=A0A316G8C2_9RHOB|nr:MBL fold metallo-hydrolase [Silicimonas algicola]AZQ67221.1 MBL fold metallo-hydrolase [Silicimonas algicola]PWK56883.1 hydroxyacylglutathione hydrolase [Silicimonas algicola]
MTRPEPGVSVTLADGLRRVLAPNPSPMTHWGTNSFILGEGRVAVIDPGPEDADHLAALLKATAGETVTHILVTHAHRDHSPLSRRLAELTGAPVLAFGPPEAGRSPLMTRLVAEGMTGGGEGIDHAFRPDETLTEGDRIEGEGWALDVLHTPGHFAGHLAFAWGDRVISGDHVMDWSSSLVSPPDGDIADFMATSARLRDLGAVELLPAHGGVIRDPADRLDWLISHRRTREAQILAALGPSPVSLEELTASVYTDIPVAMLPAAARNVFAHLIDLVHRNLATAEPDISPVARFLRR